MAAKSANWYEENWKKYKQCTLCGEYKEAIPTLFSRKKTWFLWLRSICKGCERKKYIENKSHISHISKKRYRNKREEILFKVKEYYQKNKSEKIEYAKQYRIDNKDNIKYKDTLRYYNKHYWIDTIESINEYRKIKKDKYENITTNQIDRKWWGTFHEKTYTKVKKKWLYKWKCAICWEEKKLLAHHPDYNNRKKVVLCCYKCHNLIHNGKIECPTPIDLWEI